jgi:hypothetical protein
MKQFEAFCTDEQSPTSQLRQDHDNSSVPFDSYVRPLKYFGRMLYHMLTSFDEFNQLYQLELVALCTKRVQGFH